MEWKERLTQIHQAEGLQGIDLIKRYLANTHNSPNLPPQAYDGNDPMPLLHRLSEEERVALRMPELPVRFQPATLQAIAPTLALPPLTFQPLLAIAQAQPTYTIRVHVICCANDDGSMAYAKPEDVRQWMGGAVAEANAIYAAQGAGITLSFNKGDVEQRNSSLLNQDFFVPAGTNLHTPPDTKPLTDTQIKQLGGVNETERNKVCAQYPGKCVFLLVAGTNLQYDNVGKVWTLVPRVGFAYSWEDKQFVNFPAQWGALHGPEVAHESGHYFHLWHTHNSQPKTVQDAVKIVQEYVQKSGDAAHGLNVFDNDLPSGVMDTPPDPGPDFYQAYAGTPNSACLIGVAPKLTVDTGSGHTQTYAVAADRGDVMSYFKDCGNITQHFSADQIKRMRGALETGNRRHLIAAQVGDTAHPHLRFSGLWNAGTQAQVWWSLCSETDFRNKTGELWGSMRPKQMLAVVQGGQTFYAGLWEAGTYPQVWWPNCSEQEFRDKTGLLWNSMRPAQAQAFVLNGQVRYSCLWNAGTQAQVWWPNCSEQELRDKTNTVWNTMRIKQMQAFVVNGQVRYSCLWEAGNYAQVWLPNCSEQEFRAKTGELWATMRPAQVQAFVVNGQTRFSCLWNAGTQAQAWWPLATEEQVRQETGDTWDGFRPAQWYPVAI